MKEIRFVWSYLKGRRGLFITGLLLTVLTSGIVIVNPYLSKVLVDDVIRGGKRNMLIPVLLIMSGVVLVKTSLFMLKVVCMEKSSQHMLMSVRKKIFVKIQNQDLSYFDKVRAGDLITRATGDLEYLRHFVAFICYVFVDTVVTFISATCILLFVNPWLTLALIAVLPFIVFTSTRYSKKVFPIYRNIRQKLSFLNIGATENISGNRVVKAFANEEHEIDKFDVKSKEFKSENMKAAYAWQKIVPVIDLLAQMLSFITILVGGAFAIKGDISIGDLALFTSLTWALSNPMRNISGLLNDMQRFYASADKVIEVCEAEPEIKDADGAIDSEGRIKGKIEFSHVSFAYGKDRVLDDISFVIEPEETVAIIGPTGSGKTTISNLIARFYDTTEGQVLIDGVDVRKRTLSSIRKAVSIATQDVFLFSDTIDGNIAFCNPEMEVEQVHECARLACADSFIRKMPDGYDTIVGERGVGLSGGQRQRIALARAIAAIPSVLILDDTTSAVDMETEKQMQYNLHHLPFYCTTIIIAQRISSVKNADKIIVLEDKKISVGTHDSLMRTNAYYRKVCELQDVPDMPPFEGKEAV